MIDSKSDELDWIRVREDLNENYTAESFQSKLKRKVKENPLVPIGCLATVTALTVGLINFYKGDSKIQQHMMRARVAAQAFTMICVITGFILLPKTN